MFLKLKENTTAEKTTSIKIKMFPNPAAKFSDYHLCNDRSYVRQTDNKTETSAVLSLHPNPAVNSVMLNYSLIKIEIVKVLILGLTGRAIQLFVLNSNETQKEINLSSSIPGNYIVKVTSDNKVSETLKISIIN